VSHRSSLILLVLASSGSAAAEHATSARLDVGGERVRSFLETDRGSARVAAASTALAERVQAEVAPGEFALRLLALAEAGRAAEAVHVLRLWSSAPSVVDATARRHLERCSACVEVTSGAGPAPLCQPVSFADTFTREQPLRERVARLPRATYEGLPVEALDLDGDGTLETRAADLDEDGLLDRVRVDLTADGLADLEFHFEAGEWRTRRVPPWESLGPAGALDRFRCASLLPPSILRASGDREEEE
jgi:hypothetical protein